MQAPAGAGSSEDQAPSVSGAEAWEQGSGGSVVDSQAWAERPAPVDGREPDKSRSLPELRMRHIGLHIGGGPNDEETRRPILRALESHEMRFLRCYRYVDGPASGGVYGVDLYVGARGGQPEVRATRQKLGSEQLEACMEAAFRGVSLPRPPRPTIVSYSLRFDVVDSAAE